MPLVGLTDLFLFLLLSLIDHNCVQISELCQLWASLSFPNLAWSRGILSHHRDCNTGRLYRVLSLIPFQHSLHLSLQNRHCVRHILGWSLTRALQVLGGMPRKPSTTIGFPKNPIASSPNTMILVTTESNVLGSSSPQQQHSIRTLGSSASPQQKIIHVLVNRLQQKVI